MIVVDYKDREPIFMQIVKRVEYLIAMGVYTKDMKLPSVRALAVDLSINPNTIQKAYTMLEAKGVIYTVKGIGMFVAWDKEDAVNKRLDGVYTNVEHALRDGKSIGLTKDIFKKWTDKLIEEVWDDSDN